MKTLEQLNEKLQGKLWEKDGKKRIYLDRGNNTKKMKTSTYVELSPNGSFIVKCFINCPSQNWNWIKSQQEQVIEGVEESIEWATKEEVFVVKKIEDDTYLDCIGNGVELEDAEKFLSYMKAVIYLTNEMIINEDMDDIREAIKVDYKKTKEIVSELIKPQGFIIESILND